MDTNPRLRVPMSGSATSGALSCKLTDGIRLEIRVVTQPHISSKEARENLASLLFRPIKGKCDYPRCTVEHSQRLHINTGHPMASWSILEPRLCPLPSATLRIASVYKRLVNILSLAIMSPACGFWAYESYESKFLQSKCQKDFHKPAYSTARQIMHVVECIRQINESPQCGILAVITDHNCTLQVDVRSASASGFEFTTLKNLLKFCALFEAHFDTIQSSKRIRRGLSDTFQFCAAVHNCRNSLELLQVCEISPFASRSINIMRLLAHTYYPGSATFLQHEATLDIAEVMAWVTVCNTIVSWLETTSNIGVVDRLWASWNDTGHNFLDLLRHVGVEESLVDHYSSVLSGTDAQSYEQMVFERAIQRAAVHPAGELLQHAACERYRQRNRFTISKTIIEKIMKGHYGWLPVGSPYHIPEFPPLVGHEIEEDHENGSEASSSTARESQ